jgi:hypothetical protein
MKAPVGALCLRFCHTGVKQSELMSGMLAKLTIVSVLSLSVN